MDTSVFIKRSYTSVQLIPSQIDINNLNSSKTKAKPSSKEQRRRIETLYLERNIRYAKVLELARIIAKDWKGDRIKDLCQLSSSETRQLIERLKQDNYMMVQSGSNHK